MVYIYSSSRLFHFIVVQIICACCSYLLQVSVAQVDVCTMIMPHLHQQVRVNMPWIPASSLIIV